MKENHRWKLTLNRGTRGKLLSSVGPCSALWWWVFRLQYYVALDNDMKKLSFMFSEVVCLTEQKKNLKKFKRLEKKEKEYKNTDFQHRWNFKIIKTRPKDFFFF